MLVFSECGDESPADRLSIGLKICEQCRRIIQVEKSRLWRPSPHIGFISRHSNAWLREASHVLDSGLCRL